MMTHDSPEISGSGVWGVGDGGPGASAADPQACVLVDIAVNTSLVKKAERDNINKRVLFDL